MTVAERANTGGRAEVDVPLPTYSTKGFQVARMYVDVHTSI